MPVYEHLCEKGHKFDRYLKLVELDLDQVCECGSAAKRIITPVMFSIDATNFPAYESPTTGKWITSKTQRKEDMAVSNCVDYEPSLKDEQTKRIAREDAELEQKVDEHVEKTIYEMPTAKREKLASEVEHLDIEVTRA